MFMSVRLGLVDNERSAIFTYPYPRPSVTVDNVIFRQSAHRQVLLIKRGKEPFKDCWAFPGGFLNSNEDLATGAARELKEETGLTVDHRKLLQVGAYGAPGRDPRGHTITIAFTATLDGLASVAPILGQDDAAEAQWFDIGKDLPPLAFDHYAILLDALQNF
jgi:8-oxo-dGTP diphosphatase